MPPNEFTEYYPNRFQVSFEVGAEQMEVHVLPQFTFLEMMSAIGGLLFIGYIIGQLIFPLCAKFYQENELMSQLYSNVLEKKDGTAERA